MLWGPARKVYIPDSQRRLRSYRQRWPKIIYKFLLFGTVGDLARVVEAKLETRSIGWVYFCLVLWRIPREILMLFWHFGVESCICPYNRARTHARRIFSQCIQFGLSVHACVVLVAWTLTRVAVLPLYSLCCSRNGLVWGNLYMCITVYGWGSIWNMSPDLLCICIYSFCTRSMFYVVYGSISLYL